MVSSAKTCTIVTGVWRMRLIHLLVEFQYSSVRCTNNVSYTFNYLPQQVALRLPFMMLSHCALVVMHVAMCASRQTGRIKPACYSPNEVGC